MKLTRRKFLQVTAGVVGTPVFPRLSLALDYPTRPVRLIVGFSPGGAADISARLIAQSLSARLAQQFLVENRTGAGGTIATEEVVRAAPDGYILLYCAFANASAALYSRLDFDFLRDIAPVASTVRLPLILIVNPAVPAKTLPEFITYAKTNPNRINFASAGIGTSEHLAGELFKTMSGIEMTHISFRGGAPAITALIAGDVQAYFCATPTSLLGIKAGMRAMAVTTAARWEALSDLPTVAETLPGYEVSVWYGVGTPKNTPDAVIDKLNKGINEDLADPMFTKRLAELGAIPLSMTPADFGKLLVSETEKWTKVIRMANIKAD